MPCMKRAYRGKRAAAHWSAARNEERFSSRDKAANQPLTNRLSTGDFVPAFGLYRISLVRASGETFRRLVFDASGGTRDACLLGDLFCRRPVLAGPAPPPCRALRLDPPVVCPGFGFDRCPRGHEGRLCPARTNLPGLPAKPPRRTPPDPTRPWCVRVSDSTGQVQIVHVMSGQVKSSQSKSNQLSNPNPGHAPGGLVRGGARRDGAAGRGRAAQDADGIVRPGENSSSYPPDDGKMTSWVCLWKHELRNPHVNRRRNESCGLRPVDPRFIMGTRGALRSWMLTSVPSPIRLCKFFSGKAYPGNVIQVKSSCRVQNPNISRAARSEAAHGGAAGRGGDGQIWTLTNRFAQSTTVLLITSMLSKKTL